MCGSGDSFLVTVLKCYMCGHCFTDTTVLCAHLRGGRVVAVSGRSGCSDPSGTVRTAPLAVSWQASPAPGAVITCIILSLETYHSLHGNAELL